MPPSEKIIQLRQLLSERFPGKRFSTGAAEKANPVWPTGIAHLDTLLQGGLPKSGIIEVVSERKNSGSALLISALLRKAAGENQIITLIDGLDSFDPSTFEKEMLSRLLWVRCRNAGEAMKAVDLILRDRNLPLVLLDLALNSAKELRKIPATTWYRLQRITELSSTIFVVVTPQPIVGCAEVRLQLQSRFTLEDLDLEQTQLPEKLKAEVAQFRLHIVAASDEKVEAG
ncbi:MAG: hypothetical protein ABIQ35_12350 [Verrucomicrobiota bacterium]